MNSKKYLLLLAHIFLSAAVADTPQLVKDINTTPGAIFCYNEVQTRFNRSPSATAGKIFFSCATPEAGEEMWVSDGTTNGTKMVADSIPGPNGMLVYTVTPLVDSPTPLAFFMADDGEHGLELWRTDGTGAGTYLLSDLFPGVGSSTPSSETPFGPSKVAFSATSPAEGNELRISDGTSVTTIDIVPGATGSSPNNIVYVPTLNKIVFVAATPANGRELWISDGTPAGTSLLKDIRVGSASSSPAGLVVNTAGNGIFFSASTSADGNELWKSDGTPGGTVLVGNIAAGTASSFPTALQPGPGGLLFFATTSAAGYEPYFSDGSSITNLGEINPGAGAGLISSNIAATLSRYYFTGYNPASGEELYEYTPGNLTPTLVVDLVPGAVAAGISNLRPIGDKLLFNTTHVLNGETKLYVTSGLPGNTQVVREINPTPGGSISPTPLGMFSNDLVFRAFNGDSAQIWRTNGTVGGTYAIKDLDILGTTGNSNPGLGAFLGNRMVFGASNGLLSVEPYLSDGTTAGTQLLKDLNPGALSSISNSSPLYVSQVLGKWFSLGVSGDSGLELFVSDGTPAGTNVVGDLATDPLVSRHSTPAGFTDFKGKVYFVAFDDSGSSHLYYSDGVSPSVKITGVGAAASLRVASTTLAVLNDRLFFSGTGDAAVGNELYSTDGTTEGISLVVDFNAGAPSSVPNNLFSDGKLLYFRAGPNSTVGNELVISDGTASGTVLLADLDPTPGAGSVPSNFIKLGKYVYFAASNQTDGRELYRTDGTIAGTVYLGDLHPGSGSSNPLALGEYGIGEINGRVVFAALTPNEGTELWVTDGTAAETKLLKDIYPGARSSSPSFFVNVSGKLLFAADDGVHGNEIWETDGTAAGTTMKLDFNPGPLSSSFGYPIYKDGILYSRLNNGVTGAELYSWVLDKCPQDPLKTEPGACGCGVLDADANGNGKADCIDSATPNPTNPGVPSATVKLDKKKRSVTFTTTVVSGASSYEYVLTYKKKPKGKSVSIRFSSADLVVKRKFLRIPKGTKISYQIRAVVGGVAGPLSGSKTFRAP